jgi:hypothetical protein
MTNTPIEALSAINVGVVNDQGLLEAVITLEEFVRVAKSQHIYMHTNAPRGEIDFDLTTSNTDNIIAKVANWRKEQQKNVTMAGVDLCSSGSIW